MSEVVRLAEWQVADPRSHPPLRRGELSADIAARIKELNRTGQVEIVELREGLRIETRSSVGSIRLGDLTLQIQPKIAPDVIPVFMRYALGLDTVSPSPVAAAPVQEFSFTDLVALLLRDEVDLLVHAGLLQEYRTDEAWLSSPKGRIRFEQLARHPVRSQIAAPCRFIRRTPDVVLNRLVLGALAALRPAVNDHPLAFDLHSREMLFRDLCRSEPLSRQLLEEARGALDRRSRYYEPLVRIAELILAGLGPAFEADRSAALPGFLFDMNRLFERFVARLCREHAPEGLRIETQETMGQAYRYLANPHGWPVPRLCPDIVVRARDGTPLLVLDTKYKRLDGAMRTTSADLYQLTLYSLAFGREGCVPARIVYPSLTSDAAEPVIGFFGFQSQAVLASVSLYGLELGACARALRQRDPVELQGLTTRLLSPPIAMVTG